MRVLRHHATVDVLELAHTIRGMGTTQVWLEKCAAVDAKVDLHGEIVALNGPSIIPF